MRRPEVPARVLGVFAACFTAYLDRGSCTLRGNDEEWPGGMHFSLPLVSWGQFFLPGLVPGGTIGNRLRLAEYRSRVII